MRNIILFIFAIVFSACSSPSGDKSDNFTKDSLLTVNVSISDTFFLNVNTLLKMNSYSILSSDVPLANIKRAIVYEDRLYVLDSQPKIVCFNSNGSKRYLIDSKGKGPGEFMRINDFSIDKKNSILKIYDSNRRKLISYSLLDGQFISEQTMKIDPSEIASFDGENYFQNPFNYNYPKSKEFHYSLMWSKNGTDIDKKYFSHDPIISGYMFNYKSFYYNSYRLLYINRFEEIVYSLKKGSITPIYNIKLPNPPPISHLKGKPDPLTLIKSNYSVGIEDIFQCDSILYFTFTNKEYVISTFYDLAKQKVIYCGRKVWPTPSNELPVYYPIRGVYENKFFTLVEPSTILELKKEHPEVFPDNLLKIKEIDNPVLVFFAIKH